jgi:hypothetical protein
MQTALSNGFLLQTTSTTTFQCSMRILIDERLDWRLSRALTGHDCLS